jgi:hypothetical protein
MGAGDISFMALSAITSFSKTFKEALCAAAAKIAAHLKPIFRHTSMDD